MSDEEKVERFAKMAAENGVVYVASDVYDLMREQIPSRPIIGKPLFGIDMIECPGMAPGEMVTMLPSEGEGGNERRETEPESLDS